MKKCAKITISGRVQNIGFRYNAQIIANEHNITGYVKNMRNGTVFIEAEGEESDLEKFISWCRKGPTWSYVENTDIEYIPLNGYSDFKIR